MARINIEECWWSDPRRSKLIKIIGDEERADGAAVRMWRLAQENWKSGCRLVPQYIFESLEFASALLGSGLAELRGDEVYVRGSSQYLDWTREQREKARENGSKGGKKSAQRPRDASGKLLPKAAKVQATAKPKPSESKPSDSGSDSVSGSVSAAKISFSYENDAKISILPTDNGNFLIKSYCEAFKSRHGTNPDITKQDAGIAKRLSSTLSQQRIKILLAAYFTMPEAWLQKAKHPLTLFESKLKEVSVFADSGEFVTRKQVQQADSRVNTASMLRMVEEGKI